MAFFLFMSILVIVALKLGCDYLIKVLCGPSPDAVEVTEVPYRHKTCEEIQAEERAEFRQICDDIRYRQFTTSLSGWYWHTVFSPRRCRDVLRK